MSTNTTPPSSGFLARLTERQTVLLVLLVGAALYLPFAGSYGLWDPWETHYGEVARQMAKRGDFISLYWPGSPIDGEFFWSKPVLTFWVMSVAFVATGLGHAPSGTLATSSLTEWAMRVPFCLIALSGLYGVYLVTSRFVSRRAGVLASVALATMPIYSLIARQAMTDMPFVGPMTLALCLAALAIFDDDESDLPRRSAFGGKLTWPHHPAFYAAIALFVLAAFPQIIVFAIQLRWRLPRQRIYIPGFVVMVPYIAASVMFLLQAARTRRRAPLYLYSAAVLCALAVLAKGLAGLGLPVIVILAFLAFTWNWHRLARPEMLRAVALSILACAIVAVPWHHAMLVRHGKPFWNELYGDNHWKRLVAGRHGDRGSFEYFLRELGWGVLPWLAIAPAAMVWGAMRRIASARRPDGASGTDRRQEIFWFGTIWFVAAYAVVSFSMTKFHHYILPAVPGLAIAIGCFLDDVLEGGRARAARLAALVGTPLLALVTYDLVSEKNGVQRFIWLFSYDYINSPKGRPWPEQLDYTVLVACFAALFGAATLALGFRKLQRLATAGLVLASVAFTWFLLDVYMKQVSDIWSQKHLIATYYKERRSPDERLVAWQMYWRGETFYSANEIFEGPMEQRTVFLGDRNAENLKDWCARNPGKRAFFVVEKVRWGTLRSLLPEHAQGSLRVVDDTNNKFYLAVAQL